MRPRQLYPLHGPCLLCSSVLWYSALWYLVLWYSVLWYFSVAQYCSKSSKDDLHLECPTWSLPSPLYWLAAFWGLELGCTLSLAWRFWGAVLAGGAACSSDGGPGAKGYFAPLGGSKCAD